MNDRIKLADAMGISYRANRRKTLYVGLPDPFTDANDDYAVLEWMREKYSEAIVGQALSNDPNDMYCHLQTRYYLGDYARAALKVIE